MKGPITCIRDFVKAKFSDAIISEGKISTPELGKLPILMIVDMYYQWLRDHEDEYSFFMSGEAPTSYIKSEVKIRMRTNKLGVINGRQT